MSFEPSMTLNRKVVTLDLKQQEKKYIEFIKHYTQRYPNRMNYNF